MVMKTVLCLVGLIVLCSSASFCPTYTCDSDLASNVGASFVSGQAFKLNSNGCQSDTIVLPSLPAHGRNC